MPFLEDKDLSWIITSKQSDLYLGKKAHGGDNVFPYKEINTINLSFIGNFYRLSQLVVVLDRSMNNILFL